MGWSAKAIFCSNKFLGYAYQKAGGNLSTLECGKRQINAVNAVASNSLPQLTDDQKMAILQLIADETQNAAQAATKAGAYIEVVTLRDAAGITKQIRVVGPHWAKFAEEMTSHGGSVTGLAGGFVISFGMALLDTDVAQGVSILWDSSTRKDEYAGARMSRSRIKALEEAFHSGD